MQRQYDGKAPKVTLWDVKKDVLTVLDGLGISIDSLKRLVKHRIIIIPTLWQVEFGAKKIYWLILVSCILP